MPSSRLDLQKLLAAVERRMLEVEREMLHSLPREDHERLIQLLAGLETVRSDTLQALTDGEPPKNAAR